MGAMCARNARTAPRPEASAACTCAWIGARFKPHAHAELENCQTLNFKAISRTTLARECPRVHLSVEWCTFQASCDSR